MHTARLLPPFPPRHVPPLPDRPPHPAMRPLSVPRPRAAPPCRSSASRWLTWLRLILALLFSLPPAASVAQIASSGNLSPATDPAPSLTPPAASAETSPRIYTFPGLLLPYHTALIKSQHDEIVASVHVDPGDIVRAGELLVQLAADRSRVTRDRAAALLEQARADLQRIHNLHDQELTTDEHLEAAETALKIAEADYALASLRLEDCYIRAPFDGIAAELYVNAGTSVEAGDDVVRITAPTPLRVETLLPEEVLSALASETLIEVTPVFPDTTLQLRVTARSVVVDPASGTFTLQIPIENRDQRLVPGVSCRVTFATSPVHR